MEFYKNLSLENIVFEFEGVTYTEQWKDIVGYEDLYKVSDFGRVKSLGQSVSRSNGYLYQMPGRILKLGISSNGYLHTSFYKNSVSKTLKITTLVWDHFGDRPRNGRTLQVDHIDEIKTNNWIGNLRLLTQRDNLSRNFANGKLLLGVRFCDNRYQARIYIKGKRVTIGSYKTELEAHEAYLKAKQCA